MEHPKIQALIGARNAVFYTRDLETNETFADSAEQINERHRPFSTFKIPNLLIALETGVETSLQPLREWNEELRPARDDFDGPFEGWLVDLG